MNNKKINDFLAYAKTLTPEKLGELVLEHISESAHQGWDGFSPRDLSSIGRFLEDVQLYGKGMIEAGEKAKAGLLFPAPPRDFVD